MKKMLRDCLLTVDVRQNQKKSQHVIGIISDGDRGILTVHETNQTDSLEDDL